MPVWNPSRPSRCFCVKTVRSGLLNAKAARKRKEHLRGSLPSLQRLKPGRALPTRPAFRPAYRPWRRNPMDRLTPGCASALDSDGQERLPGARAPRLESRKISRCVRTSSRELRMTSRCTSAPASDLHVIARCEPAPARNVRVRDRCASAPKPPVRKIVRCARTPAHHARNPSRCARAPGRNLHVPTRNI